MFKIIAIVIVVVVAGVLAYAAFQPDTFRIERSASIKAPPEKIFVYMNDFQKAAAWSPYEKKDPTMKRSFSGAPSGKGSVYEFEGNKDIGAARIEIVESVPPSKVTLHFDWVRPFEGESTVEYTLVPKGGMTEVTWSLSGKSPYLARLMCLFFNMDKMVGKDFEAGLASLKALVEKG